MNNENVLLLCQLHELLKQSGSGQLPCGHMGIVDKQKLYGASIVRPGAIGTDLFADAFQIWQPVIFLPELISNRFTACQLYGAAVRRVTRIRYQRGVTFVE